MSGFRIAANTQFFVPPKRRPTKKKGDVADFIVMPPIFLLHEMFEIDSSVPQGLRWRNRPREHFRHEIGYKFFSGKYPGSPAGCLSGKYYRVTVTFPEGEGWVSTDLHNHRVIWAMVNWRDPGIMMIDHIDLNKTNNEPGNLRAVTTVQSCQNRSIRSNNRSGTAGVMYRSDIGKWRAQITVDKRRIDLGSFSSLEDAIKVRKEAEATYFGEYAPMETSNEVR